MNQFIPLLFLAIFLLSACAINSQEKLNKSSSLLQLHQKKVNDLTQYQVYGTFFYLFNQKKFFGRFLWKQIEKDNYHLLLLNPFGNIEIELNIRPKQIKIIGGGIEYDSELNDEEIIFKNIGMPIPFNKLQYWILGLPVDAIDYKIDEQGHLINLNYKQNGKIWKVVYGTYDTIAEVALPSTIEITENGKYIKLKMNNWILK